jgi:hypothetical protein
MWTYRLVGIESHVSGLPTVMVAASERLFKMVTVNEIGWRSRDDLKTAWDTRLKPPALLLTLFIIQLFSVPLVKINN